MINLEASIQLGAQTLVPFALLETSPWLGHLPFPFSCGLCRMVYSNWISCDSNKEIFYPGYFRCDIWSMDKVQTLKYNIKVNKQTNKQKKL